MKRSTLLLVWALLGTFIGVGLILPGFESTADLVHSFGNTLTLVSVQSRDRQGAGSVRGEATRLLTRTALTIHKIRYRIYEPRYLANSQHSEALMAQGTNLSEKWVLYDPDPDHIWNRLYRGLYRRVSGDGREFGYDELDPLLWYQSRHLLSGPSHQRAIELLDEFLSTEAQKFVIEPLKRAIFLRDLWAIFDWSTEPDHEHPPQKRDLQIKLAQAIRRLALPKQEIQNLPSNYADAIASKAFATRYPYKRPGRICRGEPAARPHTLFF